MTLYKFAITMALLCVIPGAFSQSFSEFIVIDELREDIDQLVSAYGDQDNVYITEGFSPTAIEKISNSLRNIQIEELHIYTATKPGAIVFSSISITSENESDWSPSLKEWAGMVSSRVVIHSDVVFTGEEGIRLKQLLEKNSGLVFTSRN